MVVGRHHYTCDDLIVGAGMQGIMAAHACISNGRSCVVMDKGRGVGGILQPILVDDVGVDSGCHIWGVREKHNISFIENELGIEMIPLHGDCEISASLDGTIRRRLSVPSFEYLPEQMRRETIERAREMDPAILGVDSIGETYPKAYGSHVSDAMLSIAKRMYGRDPSDLTLGAAEQMAIGRIKLHTCDELRSGTEEVPDFGPLLCSHPLEDKGDTVIKYRYPVGGLKGFSDTCASWMRANTQKLMLSASPRSLALSPGVAGGRLETREETIEFQRLLWCCNPLALGTLVSLPLPAKAATAGSQFRVFIFEIDGVGCCVEYSHDFRLDSPMFRSWVPPSEMTAGISDQRYVVVECPNAAKTPDVINSVRDHVAHLHGLDPKCLKCVDTRPQVRFFPTVTYINWLGELSESLSAYAGSVLIPESPLYGKDVITDWWTKAVVSN